MPNPVCGVIETDDGLPVPYCGVELRLYCPSMVAAGPSVDGSRQRVLAPEADRVVGTAVTDERGEFRLFHEALPLPRERYYLAYTLRDHMGPGQSTVVFTMRCLGLMQPASTNSSYDTAYNEDFQTAQLWRVRYPHVGALDINQARIVVRPHHALIPTGRGTASVRRAVFAYQSVIRQHIWFRNTMRELPRLAPRYLRPGFALRHRAYDLPHIRGLYPSRFPDAAAAMSSGRAAMEFADYNVTNSASPTFADDDYFRFAMAHEYGHWIDDRGGRTRADTAGSHGWDTADTLHDCMKRRGEAARAEDPNRDRAERQLADDLNPFAGITNPVLDALGMGRDGPQTDPELLAQRQALVLQLSIDFSEAYATLIGQCFRGTNAIATGLDAESPLRSRLGFGDSPSVGYLWDLCDSQADGEDRAAVPFPVVHALCCQWGADIESGALYDVPRELDFGAEGWQSRFRWHPSNGMGRFRTLPGFHAYLKRALKDEYASRLDALIAQNGLSHAFERFERLRRVYQTGAA